MIEYERHDLTGVPDYRAAELEAKQSDYCLLIPVINGGARILTELGLRACEVLVTRVYPAIGKTPTKITGFKGNSDLLEVLLATMAGKYNP